MSRAFQIDFSQRVKEFTHQQEKEANIAEIWQLFRESYGLTSQKTYILTSFEGKNTENHYDLSAQIALPNQESVMLEGVGNGLLSAFINAINTTFDRQFAIEQYDEHSLGKASDSQAICYVVLKEHDSIYYGVAIGDDIAKTSMETVKYSV